MNETEQIKKALREFFTEDPLKTHAGITSRALPFSSDGSISYQGGVIAYEFHNLSNTPVVVNGMFLDRYFSGTLANPTVIGGNGYKWVPQRKAGERDTGFYDFKFQRGYYGPTVFAGN